MRAIDLNADLGETVDGVATADDEAMFALVSSANVACGGHAGDDESMRLAVERAARFGVAVGAHPSYVDRENFGRIAQAPTDLRRDVATQLSALERAGADIRYVKPHGALYHAITRDAQQAADVAGAVADLSERLGRALPILGLEGRIEDAAARHGLPYVREAFLDRGYTATGGLVPRGERGDLLHDPEVVARRAVRLVEHGTVDSADGTLVAVHAASLCLHGDTAEAVQMARAVHAALDAASIAILPPW